MFGRFVVLRWGVLSRAATSLLGAYKQKVFNESYDYLAGGR